VQLLIIRHAPAEDRVVFAARGRPDSERPLTERGRSKMRENARAVRALVGRIDAVAASPYARAVQTAEILASACAERGRPLAVETSTHLEPAGSRQGLLSWLGKLGEDPSVKTVAIVGHEPEVGHIAAWLVTGSATATLPLKKGGACLLDLAMPPVPGQAELRWLLPPALLRELAPRSRR
jgi:phosphohistidine phosphatase